MTYSEPTERLMAEVKARGLNIWAMLAIFKKRSRLAPQIPDEVIQAVCLEYLSNKRIIKLDFPYFLQVLTRKSREYFFNKNQEEHEAIKKEPLAIGDIMKRLAGTPCPPPSA